MIVRGLIIEPIKGSLNDFGEAVLMYHDNFGYVDSGQESLGLISYPSSPCDHYTYNLYRNCVPYGLTGNFKNASFLIELLNESLGADKKLPKRKCGYFDSYNPSYQYLNSYMYNDEWKRCQSCIYDTSAKVEFLVDIESRTLAHVEDKRFPDEEIKILAVTL